MLRGPLGDCPQKAQPSPGPPALPHLPVRPGQQDQLCWVLGDPAGRPAGLCKAMPSRPCSDGGGQGLSGRPRPGPHTVRSEGSQALGGRQHLLPRQWEEGRQQGAAQSLPGPSEREGERGQLGAASSCRSPSPRTHGRPASSAFPALLLPGLQQIPRPASGLPIGWVRSAAERGRAEHACTLLTALHPSQSPAVTPARGAGPSCHCDRLSWVLEPA